MLRNIYTGATDSRGRANQSMVMYQLEAPICVIGETKMESDPAIMERTLYVSPNKNWLLKNEEAKDRYYALKAKALSESITFKECIGDHFQPKACRIMFAEIQRLASNA